MNNESRHCHCVAIATLGDTEFGQIQNFWNTINNVLYAA